MSHRRRIMYIEDKSQGPTGSCRIGWVQYSKSGRSLTYGGRTFQVVGNGYKYNHIDVENGDRFWISGPRKDGADGLYGRITQAGDVDDDAAEAYWTEVRATPRARATV